MADNRPEPDGSDAYTAEALALGRPGHWCSCKKCACILQAHSPGLCIWCRNGMHNQIRFYNCPGCGVAFLRTSDPGTCLGCLGKSSPAFMAVIA